MSSGWWRWTGSHCSGLLHAPITVDKKKKKHQTQIQKQQSMARFYYCGEYIHSLHTLFLKSLLPSDVRKIDQNWTSQLINPSHLMAHLIVVAPQDFDLIARVWAAVVNVTAAKEKVRSRSIKSEESVLAGRQGMDGRVQQAQDFYSGVRRSCPARNKKSPVKEMLTINLFGGLGIRMCSNVTFLRV